jgi:hypothetical protein
MEQFISWYRSEPRLALTRTVLLRFRLHLESLGLAAGTINQRFAAVRRLAYEATDSGLLSPELPAAIRRVSTRPKSLLSPIKLDTYIRVSPDQGAAQANWLAGGAL